MISDWMRQAAGNSIRANVEAQFLFGTVEGVGPLKVRMDKTYILEPGLKAGDRVILLSLAGEYLILGKVGEEGDVREVEEGV